MTNYLPRVSIQSQAHYYDANELSELREALKNKR